MYLTELGCENGRWMEDCIQWWRRGGSFGFSNIESLGSVVVLILIT